MTQTSNEISPLTRTYIKANNIVVWHIESESGHTYATTIFEGKVTSCKREDGTSCPGFDHKHTCHHAALAQAREAERAITAEQRAELLPFAQDYAAYQADVKAQRDAELKAAEKRPNYDLPLHGAKGFSLLK